MPKDDSSPTSPQDVADAALLAKMGTDPEAWASELRKVMPAGINQTLAAAWFYHAIEAGRKAAGPILQPMDAARKDGGWVLGLVRPDGPTEARWQPWTPVTWSDGPMSGEAGWYDDDGGKCEPSVWVAIPDPQPRNTGWMPPAGTIEVAEITGDGWTSNGKPIEVSWRWAVSIKRPDGSYDEYRESDYRNTYDQAEAVAARWAEKYRLPIVVVPLAIEPGNVVSLRKGDTLQ